MYALIGSIAAGMVPPLKMAGAVSIPKQSAAGASTFEPANIGVGGVLIPAQASAGTGTFAPTFLGAGAIAIAGQSTAGAATFIALRSASGAVTIPAQTVAGAGEQSVTNLATGTVTIAKATAAGVADVEGIPASATGAHRYWRVYVDAIQSSTVVSIMHIQMRESTYGPNVISGGTANASSSYGGYAPAETFNFTLHDIASGDQDFWAANQGTGSWISYDFGSGNAKDIQALDLWCRVDAREQMPKDFRLQYSDDGTTWTDRLTVTGQTNWRSREHRKFVSPYHVTPAYSGSPHGAHTYWRLLTTEASASVAGVTVGELQFRSTPGVAQLSTGGTAYANTVYGAGYEADKAFDGSTTTLWAGSNSFPGIEGVLQYQHATARAVAQLALTSRHDAAYGSEPDRFQLWYSDNGTQWTHAADFVDEPAGNWAAAETRLFTDPAYVTPSDTGAILREDDGEMRREDESNMLREDA